MWLSATTLRRKVAETGSSFSCLIRRSITRISVRCRDPRPSYSSTCQSSITAAIMAIFQRRQNSCGRVVGNPMTPLVARNASLRIKDSCFELGKVVERNAACSRSPGGRSMNAEAGSKYCRRRSRRTTGKTESVPRIPVQTNPDSGAQLSSICSKIEQRTPDSGAQTGISSTFCTPDSGDLYISTMWLQE